MAQCPSCGGPVTPRDTYCQSCGAEVPAVGVDTTGGADGGHTTLVLNGLFALLLGAFGLLLVVAGVSHIVDSWSTLYRWVAVAIGGVLVVGAYGQVKRRIWGWAVGVLAWGIPVLVTVAEGVTGATVTPTLGLVVQIAGVLYLLARAPYFGISPARLKAGLAELTG